MVMKNTVQTLMSQSDDDTLNVNDHADEMAEDAAGDHDGHDHGDDDDHGHGDEEHCEDFMSESDCVVHAECEWHADEMA